MEDIDNHVDDAELNNGNSDMDSDKEDISQDDLKNSAGEEDNQASAENDAENSENEIKENNGRPRRLSGTKDLKVPEKKASKRKSLPTSETPKAKMPRCEPFNIELKAKTIVLPRNSEFHTLDRIKLTTIPPKEGAFEVGELIWAKIQGYPWWPCIVTIDPETGTYSKISGVSYKADRVYHIQYFGAQAYRGWTNVGMVMPFEGLAKFNEKINAEIENLPQKRASKVMAKYAVKPSFKKKLDESIMECEEAMKLNQVERIRKLTFNYVYASDVKDSKRKSNAADVSLNVSSTSNKSTTKSSKKTLIKKSKNSPEDIYDFDEDSDGFASEPLPGLMFAKRNAKGDFQVYLRKHFDDESKANPKKSKIDVTEILKNKWDLLSEDMRSLYVERKAIYEDESNMLVSKRSNFGEDYFNDSDYDYNDSDGEINDHNDFTNDNDADDKMNQSSNSLNNLSSTKKRSKSKKSEKLFDKIKKAETPTQNNKKSLNSSKRKSTPSVKPTPAVVVKTPSRKSTNSVNNETPKMPKGKLSSLDSIKKTLCISEESSDETNSSDAASVNDLEASEDIKKNIDDHFCYTCGDGEIEKNPLVACDSICQRFYHKRCIDFKEDGDKFRCNECKTNRFICFACKNPDNLDTKKCEDSKCTRFYHLSCIENNYPIRVNESANSFLCPLHTCINCHLETLNDNEYRASKRKLVKCIHCPTAFHAKDFCIGAGTVRVSKNYVICPDHYKTKNKDRHINVNYCFACISGGNLICCESCPAAFHEECLEYSLDHEKSFYCTDCRFRKQLHYRDIVWVKLGIYRWWPGRICHPNEVPENVLNLKHNDCDFPVFFFGSHDYCWVNKSKAFLFVEGDNQMLTSSSGGKSNNKTLKNTFKAALKEATEEFEKWNETRKEMSIATIANRPPPYQSINSNRYFGTKNNTSNNESNVHTCECKQKSGEKSLCVDESCLNRVSLIECDPKFCPAGEKCKNQCFKKCEYVKCKPFKTKSAGWGLMTLEDIKEGQFVIEYCGEIIDDKECEKRLKKIGVDQSNFYFLTIDKDTIIDAGPKGNLARFLNHSCEPNCVSQKWVVNNATRVGIFALQDIPANTELTFNYNLECRGNEQIKCVCGSATCSGYIGVSSSKPKNGKAKIVKSKPASSFNQMHEDVCFKCGKDGELIMCDQKGCPKSYHLPCINLNHVPKNDWICPRHTCMKSSCKEAAFIFCSVCPNSLCKAHESKSKILQLPDNQFLCEAHRSSDDDGLITESEVNGVTVDK